MVFAMYREMPGLQLHLDQAVRLFGLAPATCRDVLDQLVNRGALRRTRDGQYAIR
jgi:DNA-binding IclR family transcriptional regulator